MSKLDNLMQKLCPDGVEYKTLGEIGPVCMCKRVMKAETTSEGDVPFFKIGTFGKEPDAYISQELFENYKKLYSYPKKGDLLVSASGTIGRVVVFDGEPAYFQDSNIVWIDNDETLVLNSFLFYCYQLQPWKVANGGTITRLYNDNIKKAKIPVPPLEVQSEIVHIMDNFTELTVELTAELSARRKQFDFYKTSFFRNDCNYPSKHITDIALVKARVGWQRLTKAEYLTNGDAYLITGTDFSNGKINFNTCCYVTKERYDMDENIQVHKNDILITKDGTLGKVAMLNEEPNKIATLNSGVFNIRITDKNVNPRYIFYYFNSSFFTSFILHVKTGSTIPHLTQMGLTTLNIPLPPLPEQERIVSILDRFDTLCNDLTSGLPAEIEARQKQYEYYRDKLLDFKKAE